MANKRIFYGKTAIGFNCKDDDPKVVFNEDRSSVGFRTDFPAPEFDMGELVIYGNIEQIPDEEVDISKSVEIVNNCSNYHFVGSQEPE